MFHVSAPIKVASCVQVENSLGIRSCDYQRNFVVGFKRELERVGDLKIVGLSKALAKKCFQKSFKIFTSDF